MVLKSRLVLTPMRTEVFHISIALAGTHACDLIECLGLKTLIFVGPYTWYEGMIQPWQMMDDIVVHS